jgi:cyclomaltodextrinase
MQEQLQRHALPTTDDTVMEDFIFGGIEADETQRIAQAKTLASGIRHLHQLDLRDPLPDQPVMVLAQVGPDAHIDRMTLYFTTDGSDPAGGRGVASNGIALPMQRVAVHWEPLLWCYLEQWQVQVPGQPENTLVQYRIEGWRSHDETVSLWSREPNLDRTPEHPTRYAYHVDRFQPPQWAREAIVYHIFVDRFAKGGGGSLPQRWLAPAELNEFVGGNLRGVIERLDYLADLGVTALWLSPIFRTTSYHGYDTSDFFAVDPRFGSDDDLRALVQAAHTRGLRVILDFVANHTSVEFPPFVEARRDSASPRRNWFRFDRAYKHGYRAFFDVASMPQLDTDQPAVRDYLIQAAQHWLKEYDVDGYRLDYAAGPSHAFWSEFRAGCRQVKPDCWLFGEVTLAGDALRAYVGRLDGCLDFALCRLLRQLCAGPQPSIGLAEFANGVERSRAFFGVDGDFLLPSFLDNHDMNRFLWVAGNDKQRLRLAAGLLFALGGPPILYYGAEIGLSQPRGKGPSCEEARHPMRWDEAQDQELLAFFKQWIMARRRHPALVYGDMVTHLLNEQRGMWLFERRYGEDRVWVAVNLSEFTQDFWLPASTLVEQTGAITQNPLTLEGGCVALLAPDLF